MVRPNLAIALIEDGKVALYHSVDNSREIYGNPISPLEFELDDGPAIEALLSAYPEPIQVSDLPHSSEEDEDKIGIAEALFKEGLLMICDEMSKPKNEGDEEEEDDDSPF